MKDREAFKKSLRGMTWESFTDSLIDRIETKLDAQTRALRALCCESACELDIAGSSPAGMLGVIAELDGAL
jgi:hypothetical protein